MFLIAGGYAGPRSKLILNFFQEETMNKNLLRILIILTGLVTALIHLFLGATSLGDSLGPPFIINGLVYLALIYAVAGAPGFLQGRERLVHYLLIGFAALTILLYFVFNGAEGLSSPLGMVSKIDEVLLIIFTWLHTRTLE
jgi:hypothetical protein